MKKIELALNLSFLLIIFFPFLVANADTNFYNLPEGINYSNQANETKCYWSGAGGCESKGWFTGVAAKCAWEPCCREHDEMETGKLIDSDNSYTYQFKTKCQNKTLPLVNSSSIAGSHWEWEDQKKTDCVSKNWTSMDCCCPTNQITAVTTVDQKTTIFTAPDLSIQIPGMDKLATITCPKEGECKIPWIGTYISALYNYGLAIAGILAAIMLMAAGVLWLISAGDASKITQAKELITGSITGLIILAASYIILLQVNSGLVDLKSVSVVSVQPVSLIENGSDSASNLNSGTCPTDSDLTDIKKIVSVNGSIDARLVKNAADGLTKATGVAAQRNVRLLVTSANRSYAKQKQLWDDKLAQYNNDVALTKKYVAPPSQCQGTCYGHCAGVAIDICILGTVSCSHMGGKANATYSDADVVKLQSIMQAAGWKRYCGEWWHFQYGLAPSQSCSP